MQLDVPDWRDPAVQPLQARKGSWRVRLALVPGPWSQVSERRRLAGRPAITGVTAAANAPADFPPGIGPNGA